LTQKGEKKMIDESKFFEILAAGVAAGATIAKSATTAGCSVSHAYRLAKTTRFRQRVSELRSEATDRAVGLLAEAAVEAVGVLRDSLSSEKTADRIASAKAILAALGPMSELAELRSRLDEMERQLASEAA
jgi:hypothetical protein